MLNYQEGQELHINLWYRAGTSDKVYNLHIVPSKLGLIGNSHGRQQGWDSWAEYGRRGANLTNVPYQQGVEYSTAWSVVSKKYREEIAKGYRDMGSTAPTNQTPFEVERGADKAGVDADAPQILPMLCGISIGAETEAEKYLASTQWHMQEKFDGIRILALVSPRLVVGLQKQGKPRAIPSEVAEWLKKLGVVVGLDGEMIGTHYVVYDLFMLNGKPMHGKPFTQRWEELCKLVPAAAGKPRDDMPVVRAQTWTTPQQKRAAFTQLQKKHAEGTIFRLGVGLYKQGRCDTLIKCKFVATGSFIVTGVRTDGSDSMTVGLHDYPGFRTNVSLIGREDVRVGDVCEIRYLYSVRNPKGASLTQAVMLGVRDDVTPQECTKDQLKFRQEEGG